MDATTTTPAKGGYLSSLNEQQLAAATYGRGPLLIIAGAGTGKTNTLAHRVAQLIAGGIDPNRMLLLTFTRRAAAEMTRRVETILALAGRTHQDRVSSLPPLARGASGGGVSPPNQSRDGSATCASAPPSPSPLPFPARRDTGASAEQAAASPSSLPPFLPPSLSSPSSLRPSVLSLSRIAASMVSRIWGGTFHAVSNRLLRLHAAAIGFDASFTVIDRSDAEDLMNAVRSELGLDKGEVRFPRKATCMAIYSRCVNAQQGIEDALKAHFPWVGNYAEQLRSLFKAYTMRKQEQNTLDYDDLLLYWQHLMQEEPLAAEVRRRFDAVLVDEYQDTNALQASILQRLCPTGEGLTVVGDDAQAIYSFRAATVHNILDFPKMFPAASVLKLEQNYRSVQPILDAANAVIALAPNRFHKDLFSTRGSRQKPRLVSLMDEEQQSDYVIKRCLEHLEAGIPLRRQGVLFRAAHHSDALEVELSRRNIPFVKYGGLKFLEAAHVKDVLAILRLAENPRDLTSAFRVLQLLDGVGPAHAKRAIAHLADHRGHLSSWRDFSPPGAASEQWPAFVEMIVKIAPNTLPLSEQIAEVRKFYAQILEARYDQPQLRARDIEQLQQISSNFRTRSQLLSDLTLDPPASTQDLAGPPLLEEDYLILSTMHSAKGCEWDCVYVIHASDGNIPSDMACGSDEEIEEERRLFYVALTRARDFLEVCFPLKYYQKKWSDRHSYAQLTRFIPEALLGKFERISLEAPAAADAPAATVTASAAIRKAVAGMWG